MFQEFRTQSYSITVYYFGFMLFFLRLTVFHVITMQRFDFKNITIAIKLFIVVLNLYLISERSQSK